MDEKYGKNVPLRVVSLVLVAAVGESRETRVQTNRQASLEGTGLGLRGRAGWDCGDVEGQAAPLSLFVSCSQNSGLSRTRPDYHGGGLGELAPLETRVQIPTWLRRGDVAGGLDADSVGIRPHHPHTRTTLCRWGASQGKFQSGNGSSAAGRCWQEPCLHCVCFSQKLVLLYEKHLPAGSPARCPAMHQAQRPE